MLVSPRKNRWDPSAITFRQRIITSAKLALEGGSRRNKYQDLALSPLSDILQMLLSN